MFRISFAKSCLLVATMMMCVATATQAEKPGPNVVLFLVDDMGWMDSSAYGSQYYETPNMERLAKQSMRFTDAYALPLCSPTRASIMTGQYTSRHGVTSASGHLPPRPDDFEYLPTSAPPNRQFCMPISKNYLDTSHYTLAEALRDAGYRTGHFGKWHLGLTSPHRPDKHGFETTWHCAPDPGPPSYFSPYGVHPTGEPTGQHRVGNITDGPDGEHIADRLTDEAISFIKAHPSEPFYLNLWHYSVHGPWQHKEAYTKHYAQKTDPRGEQGNPVMASMLQSVDESLGRILDTLDELALTENTLFIFYSDNGGNTHSWRADDRRLRNVNKEHRLYDTIQSYRRWAGDQAPTNNAPLREGKGRIYEGGQRVPLMVRWPGKIPAGSQTDAIVGPIDMYPTILDALALATPSQQIIDGESFLPILKGTGRLQREAYFTWFPHLIPAVSVRQGDWKLVRRFQPHPDYPQTHELYNLASDLGESKNLAKTMPEKVKQLDQLIDQFVERTNALSPRPNPNYKPGSSGRSGAAGRTAGLVPKFCKANVSDGVLRVEADGRTPFLGTAQVRLKGPLKLKLRLRSEQGGAGEIRWKTATQESFSNPDQIIEFEFAGGNAWQDIELNLPVRGQPQIVRIYVPAERSVVEIQSIEFSTRQGQAKRWDFSAPQ
jgi:arylsulfatase A-like enzyme